MVSVWGTAPRRLGLCERKAGVSGRNKWSASGGRPVYSLLGFGGGEREGLGCGEVRGFRVRVRLRGFRVSVRVRDPPV